MATTWKSADLVQVVLTAGAAPLFLGGLLADMAYGRTYQVQWLNFAAWLIAGAMVFAGLALAWSLLTALRRTFRDRRGLVLVLVLTAVFGLGLLDSFTHARDAWGAMPGGLILSLLTTFAAALALALSLRGRSRIFAMPSRKLFWVVLAPVLVCACARPGPETYGAEPQLPDPQRGLLPSMKIADPAPWGQTRPSVPNGYTITAIATGLGIPRQTLVLPNGDILVAEGRGGGAPASRPKDIIAGLIKAKGTTSVKSGNRLTLLRDADGDGVYEGRSVFAENLNAPYGLALVGSKIYVANQDALVRFTYAPGQTKAAAPPVKVTDLPAQINHHWTKSLAASPDGRRLYVGIGSNSNITERGMPAELDRAMVWEIDPATGAHRAYATGLRNPTALATQPGTGQLWAVVNERDEIGPNLVPDYLTFVREGGFYGWPYSYWGQHADVRVRPQDPRKVASAIRPDYSLGAHVAALGVSFSNPSLGPQFAEGAFVGEHGSWNRNPPAGYKVVFVPFRNNRPAGAPIDFVSGFQTEDGKTRGRPVGVTVDPRGALIVADDLSNTIWRVTPDRRRPAAEAPTAAPRTASETPTPKTAAPY